MIFVSLYVSERNISHSCKLNYFLHFLQLASHYTVLLINFVRYQNKQLVKCVSNEDQTSLFVMGVHVVTRVCKLYNVTVGGNKKVALFASDFPVRRCGKNMGKSRRNDF